ncbi:MAG: YihY/virulence factor BrkB family protein [Bauldia sp.]|nr:YihY/virulence factor BrkB family protein [Bauldia sp.]
MAHALRGREAHRPFEIPWEGWKDIVWRVVNRLGRDHIPLIAAGATFYLVLSLFPALASLVSLYGFFADPQAVADQVGYLATIIPEGAAEVIGGELDRLVAQPRGALGFGFFVGLVVALWSANGSVKTLFEAMNVAYAETEKRSFLRLNLVTLATTLAALLVGAIFVALLAAAPVILDALGLRGGVAETILAWARWPFLFAIALVAINLLYRYGPSRRPAKWRWITLGSLVAAVGLIIGSLGFSWYLAHFADYNATYGSLGAIIGFLMWVWISMMVLIVGAEIDAEMEHQTARDSTVGPEAPMGERGAVMADTIGKARSGDPEDALPDSNAARPGRPATG